MLPYRAATAVAVGADSGVDGSTEHGWDVRALLMYAIGTIAAAAFAAVLYKVVTGDMIVGALNDLVQR
ncbi:MAG: DUF4244 domain-containing protein, partial [Steroidobacteraceae bacterium]